MRPTQIVRNFWIAMGSNNYHQVANDWLAQEFTAYWPQSGEVIESRESFASVNAGFPGQGDWKFEEISLIAEGQRVVTDIRVTNAPLDIITRAITFHNLNADQIIHQTEFWPDPYPIPDWRIGILRIDTKLARW